MAVQAFFYIFKEIPFIWPVQRTQHENIIGFSFTRVAGKELETMYEHLRTEFNQQIRKNCQIALRNSYPDSLNACSNALKLLLTSPFSKKVSPILLRTLLLRTVRSSGIENCIVQYFKRLLKLPDQPVTFSQVSNRSIYCSDYSLFC